MRDMRISEEANVGDAVIADEEIGFYQMVFHDFSTRPSRRRALMREAQIFRMSRVCAGAKNETS